MQKRTTTEEQGDALDPWEYTSTQHKLGENFKAPEGFTNLLECHVVQFGAGFWLVCAWSRWIGKRKA
jgi:hypothetical protein